MEFKLANNMHKLRFERLKAGELFKFKDDNEEIIYMKIKFAACYYYINIKTGEVKKDINFDFREVERVEYDLVVYQ